MNKYLTLIFLLFIISQIGACQYTQNETIYSEVEILYNLNNEQIAIYGTEEIQFADITKDGFVVKNFLDYKIKIKVYYIGDQTIRKNQRGESVVEIEPKSSKYVKASRSYSYPLRIEKYTFQENDETYSKIGTISETNEICKKCGNINCLDDGMICSYDFECGGGYCIYGICNNINECYNQNCNCKENEIQCNNKTCEIIGNKKIGQMILCSEMECESYYAIDNICALTQEQIEKQEKEIEKEMRKEEKEEFNQIIQNIIITSIITGIILIGIYFAYKRYKDKIYLEIEKNKFEREQRAKGLEKYVNRFGEEMWIEIDKLSQTIENERRIIEGENNEVKKISYLIETYKSSKYQNEAEYEKYLHQYLLKYYPNCKRQSGDSTKRPDLKIGDIAIEIKGPTNRESLKTIGHKYLLYLLNHKYLIIVLFDPTFNENDNLFRDLKLALSKETRIKFIIKRSDS